MLVLAGELERGTARCWTRRWCRATGELSPIVTGHRLLRRDPRLPGRPRDPARAGVDRRRYALVRAPARIWSRSRAAAWSTAPRSSSSGARGPGALEEAQPGRSAAAQAENRRGRRARRATGRARSIASAASSTAAERAYREASRHGHEPQPGLALLRLAQGRATRPRAAIRRALGGDRDAGRAPRAAAGRRRDHARRGRAREARAAAASSSVSATRAPERCARRHARARAAARSRWRPHDAGGAARPPPRRPGSGSSSTRPTRQRATRVARRRSPAATLGDEDGAALELRGGARRPTRSWARRRTSPGSTRWLRAPRPRSDRRELEVLRLVAAGRDQPGDRGRARAQRPDRRPPRQQHLRQARRLLARRGHGLRARASRL